MTSIKSLEWQPALIVRAHPEALLRPDREALIGKILMVREIYHREPPSAVWAFCNSERTIIAQGHPDLWFCEHEILTD